MTEERVHYRAMYDSDWLYAHDLKGRDVTVTIEKCVEGELQVAGSSKKERKPVISFPGKDKRLALNKTNSGTIAAMYGPYVKDWKGKRITLSQWPILRGFRYNSRRSKLRLQDPSGKLLPTRRELNSSSGHWMRNFRRSSRRSLCGWPLWKR